MTFSVYIIQSLTTGRFYTGQTNDVEKRVGEHNSELAVHTKKEQPWKLIWTQETATRQEAMKLEKKIKSRGAGRFLNDINFSGM